MKTSTALPIILVCVAVLFPRSNASAQKISVVDDLEEVVKKKMKNVGKLLPSIQLEKGMAEKDRLAWQLYATMRRMYLDDKYPEKEGEVIPGFDEEVFARETWFNKHLKPLKSKFSGEFGIYLDGIEKTLDKKFMREYVWTFHRQKLWKQPKGLNLEGFEEFRKKELSNHKAQTRAKLVMMKPVKARGIRILLDRKAMRTETDGAIWLNYALMRFEYMRNDRTSPEVNVHDLVIPSFEEEVFARQKFADNHKKHLKGGTAKFLAKYIKELANVRKAKLMREYVWTHHRQPKWEKPKDLKLDEFKKWSAENLKDHKSFRGAAIIGL